MEQETLEAIAESMRGETKIGWNGRYIDATVDYAGGIPTTSEWLEEHGVVMTMVSKDDDLSHDEFPFEEGYRIFFRNITHETYTEMVEVEKERFKVEDC